MGYTLRCGSEFKIFTNIKGATADPKNFSEDNFITVKNEESILIPPNSFALCIQVSNILKCQEMLQVLSQQNQPMQDVV